MYSLVSELSKRSLVLRHGPAMGTSLLVAEAFFKFGSFTLEAIGFLAVWFLADLGIHVVQEARTAVSPAHEADRGRP